MLSVSLKAVIQEVTCDNRCPRLVLMGERTRPKLKGEEELVKGQNLAVALTGINSLTPVSVRAGMKNSRPVDFLQ